MRGGINIKPTLIQKDAFIFPSYGTEGASRGKKRANTSMKSMYSKTRTIPGTNAPKNISPALVDVTSITEGIDKSPVASLCRAFRRELA